MLTLAKIKEHTTLQEITVTNVSDSALTLNVVKANNTSTSVIITVPNPQPAGLLAVHLLDDNSISIAPWQEIETELVLGILVSSVFCFFDRFDIEGGIIKCASPIPLVSNLRDYLKEILPERKKLIEIRDYKQKVLWPSIYPHDSIGTCEVQIDLLTSIVKDLIALNPDMELKYGSILEKLETVSTDTVKPFNIDDLVANKGAIRTKQKEYFEYRNSLTN